MFVGPARPANRIGHVGEKEVESWWIELPAANCVCIGLIECVQPDESSKPIGCAGG